MLITIVISVVTIIIIVYSKQSKTNKQLASKIDKKIKNGIFIYLLCTTIINTLTLILDGANWWCVFFTVHVSLTINYLLIRSVLVKSMVEKE